MHGGGGGSRATTTEAGGGVDDARTGLGDADGDGASLAVEAEFGAALAGSESRADVAAEDSFALVALVYGEAMAWRIRREMKARGEWKTRCPRRPRERRPAQRKFWADVGRCSDRLPISADQQTMAPRGASEQVGKAKTSGRKADQVSYDWNGGAEGALPDVDRPKPVVETARVGMRDLMDFQAALPVGGGDAYI